MTMTSTTPLAFVTIGTNIAAMIMLIVLFFATATSGIFELEEAKDDGDNRWYDLDLSKEEREALKIVFNVLFLAVACSTLFVPMFKIWHPAKGVFDRFHVGVLCASTFLLGSMCFISFWYSINFGTQDEEDDNENNDDDDANAEEREMDADELLVYERKVIAACTFILGAVFTALSALLVHVGRQLPEAGQHNATSNRANIQAKGAGHMEILGDLWTILSSSTIAIFICLFLASIILSQGEEAERMREDGAILNLIMVLTWMAIISTGFLFLGRKILGPEKLGGTLGVGILTGGTMYFALALFNVFIMYVNPTFEERRKEDGAGSATATAAACFFLSLLHLAYSLGTYKYQSSIIAAISNNADAEDAHKRDDDASNADFQRMEDEEPTNEIQMGSFQGVC